MTYIPRVNKILFVFIIFIFILILWGSYVYSRARRFRIYQMELFEKRLIQERPALVSPTEPVGAKTGDEVFDKDTQDILNSLEKLESDAEKL
mgnify:CR=1 FL=1